MLTFHPPGLISILNTAGLAPQIPEDLYCVPRVLPLNLP